MFGIDVLCKCSMIEYVCWSIPKHLLSCVFSI